MQLIYKNKKKKEDIISDISSVDLNISEDNNILIKGDNLISLKELLKTHKGKIDLIYIDPPFATNKDFKISTERVSTISSSFSDDIAYSDKLTGSDFIEFLRERLILMRDLLSKKGSIYVHIDYKIGHYVKVIMDEIFGAKCFINDITRIKCNPKNFNRKAYGNIKDLILFYSKEKNPIWNNVQEPLTEEDLIERYNKIEKNGRRYNTIPLHAPGETNNGPTGKAWRGILPPRGRHWRCDPAVLEELDQQGLIEWSKTGNPRKKIYADEKLGQKIQDIWKFKDSSYPQYPTEKNLGLLKRIILNSSNEDSIVMDCFCGSGTTLVAAQEFGRKWIGIDQSDYAIAIIKKRLSDTNQLFKNISYNFYEIGEKF